VPQTNKVDDIIIVEEPDVTNKEDINKVHTITTKVVGGEIEIVTTTEAVVTIKDVAKVAVMAVDVFTCQDKCWTQLILNIVST
jgi:ATP-dependent Zn protease